MPLSAAAAKKVEADIHRNPPAQAKGAVNAQRTVLVADAERRGRGRAVDGAAHGGR